MAETLSERLEEAQAADRGVRKYEPVPETPPQVEAVRLLPSTTLGGIADFFPYGIALPRFGFGDWLVRGDTRSENAVYVMGDQAFRARWREATDER